MVGVFLVWIFVWFFLNLSFTLLDLQKTPLVGTQLVGGRKL